MQESKAFAASDKRFDGGEQQVDPSTGCSSGKHQTDKGTEATQLFSDTLCDYVDSTIESHFQREGETVVTVEDYLRRREENIGLYPLLALIRYGFLRNLYRTRLTIIGVMPQRSNCHRSTFPKITWTCILSGLSALG